MATEANGALTCRIALRGVRKGTDAAVERGGNGVAGGEGENPFWRLRTGQAKRDDNHREQQQVEVSQQDQGPGKDVSLVEGWVRKQLGSVAPGEFGRGCCCGPGGQCGGEPYQLCTDRMCVGSRFCRGWGLCWATREPAHC